MIFISETLHDFFKVLRQTMDPTKLHQRPHLIYNADEKGPKLTYISGNQELLAVKGSKRFREKKEKP
jgi:hypothetical protein